MSSIIIFNSFCFSSAFLLICSMFLFNLSISFLSFSIPLHLFYFLHLISCIDTGTYSLSAVFLSKMFDGLRFHHHQMDQDNHQILHQTDRIILWTTFIFNTPNKVACVFILFILNFLSFSVELLFIIL